MKLRSVCPMVVLCLFLAAGVFGQQTLSPGETQQIVRTLTSQPRRTWIATGTIEATRRQYKAAETTNAGQIQREINQAIQEYQNDPDKIEQTPELQKMKLDAIPFNVRYRMANESTTDSKVVVKYDGNRFHWQIDVLSRQDSVKPDASLAGNYMTDQFDLNFNRQRIFAWDGSKYTMYAASGKWACVDTANKFSRGVTGPLTAAVIPWGYGQFSAANLATATISATEVLLNGTKQVQADITWPNGQSASLILDPSKGYAVTACTLPGGDNVIATRYCDGYRLVTGRWVPSNVLIERRDATTNALLSSDHWTIQIVDGAVPSPSSFAVPFAANTTVEFLSTVSAQAAVYTYSNSVDTEQLLADRLTYAAQEGRRKQNCATASVGYVASMLGRTVSDSALAAIVGPDGRTSMYSMKQLLQGLGLYCRAVQTDLATLQNLSGVQAILHIPGQNHFVALDYVDEQDVRIIDLSNHKFYYRQSVDFFPQDWSEGVALLVSTSPIIGQYKTLSDAAIAAITGTAGYSCTRRLQYSDFYICSEGCEGYVTFYWERWGCESATSGTCYTYMLVRRQDTDCIPDPLNECTVTLDWYYYYMPACE